MTDELLVEAQHVGLIEDEGRPERRAEVEEEDEAGDDPDLALGESPADRREGLHHHRALRAGGRLTDECGGHREREEGKGRGEEEGAVDRAPLGEIPADLAHEDRRELDGGPLNGLKRAGEAQGLAALDHDGVDEHVGEGEAEPHHGEEAGEPGIGVRDAEPEGQARGSGQRRGEQEIALAPAPPERKEVGDEAVHRLDEPGERRDEEEVRDLPGRQAALLEHDGHGLIRQVPHPLGEIDHGEQDGEALRISTLEREEPAQPSEHGRTIRRNGFARADVCYPKASCPATPRERTDIAMAALAGQGSSAADRVRVAPVEGADTLFTPAFLAYLVRMHDAFTPRAHDCAPSATEVLRQALEQGIMPGPAPERALTRPATGRCRRCRRICGSRASRSPGRARSRACSSMP